MPVVNRWVLGAWVLGAWVRRTWVRHAWVRRAWVHGAGCVVLGAWCWVLGGPSSYSEAGRRLFCWRPFMLEDAAACERQQTPLLSRAAFEYPILFMSPHTRVFLAGKWWLWYHTPRQTHTQVKIASENE